MQTSKPALSSTPPSPTAEDRLFELPEVPSDFCEPETQAPSWGQQMTHAQMLLAWRKAQGLAEQHPPRNPEPFVMSRGH